MPKKHVYFVGYAKLPSHMSASTLYSQFTLGVLIDVTSGTIVDVSCTLISTLAQALIQEYMVGKHILDDFAAMVEEITFRHQGSAQRSIIKSLSDVSRNYTEFIARNRDNIAKLS